MASYQRVALFVFFDAIERDLVKHIRSICADEENILSDAEKSKARERLKHRNAEDSLPQDFEILHGLDIGDKFNVLLRHKSKMENSLREYFVSKRSAFDRCIPVRNAVMHGRPLTTEEYALGFSLANEFLRSAKHWPELESTYRAYSDAPHTFSQTSVALLDDDVAGEALNNLPVPDYDDTGFLPRPQLEKDLKKKILGRHPVITVLGDGGNGKTALTLQTLYGLLGSNDHGFDAIAWVSAKSSKLSTNEIKRVEGAITNSLGLFEEVANVFESGSEQPLVRVRRLLEQNKVLLVVDNLETVLDDTIRDFASDVPGESKVIFTSRVPLGSDLSVVVDAFSATEATAYLSRLTAAYNIEALKRATNDQIKQFITRLGHKPLLLKWFALGVLSGLDPARITSNPEMALRFCMENVFTQLSSQAQEVMSVMAALPTAASSSIVQHVGNFSATQVESSIAELLRFALIEQSDSGAYERLFHVKPFTKSYLIRVLNLVPTDMEGLLARYRGIDSTYQSERGGEIRNRYSPSTYTVRSRTEALAVRRLRLAVSQSLKDQFDTAYASLLELKVSTPEYFEVYRTEAFVAYRQGDYPRASAAYEMAFEVGSQQPQLHHFYAGFLMRSYGDYAEAATHYNQALELDPNARPVLREAVRCNLYLCDFPSAQSLIARIVDLGFADGKEEIAINDMQAQLYYRESEFLLKKGDMRGAWSSLISLHDFIDSLGEEIFDKIFRDHLLKALPTLDTLIRIYPDVDRDLAARLRGKIESLQPTPIDLETDEKRTTGRMRIEGRKDTYAFLRDDKGVDTFVSKASVSDLVWQQMLAGVVVTYEVQHDTTGRTWAANLALRG